jgi:hypothetical protein
VSIDSVVARMTALLDELARAKDARAAFHATYLRTTRVISDAEFDDPALLARREADHRRIDEVLAARVRAEDDELRELAPARPGTAPAGNTRIRYPAPRSKPLITQPGPAPG